MGTREGVQWLPNTPVLMQLFGGYLLLKQNGEGTEQEVRKWVL